MSKNLKDFLGENIVARIAAEPSSEAAKQAKEMNLSYLGFGRYADSTGKVAYVVDRGRLVPFKGSEATDAMFKKSFEAPPEKKQEIKTQAVKAAALQSREERKATKLQQDLNKEAMVIHNELSKFYDPSLFDEAEMSAISDYTAQAFTEINQYLYSGFPPDTTTEMAQYVVQTIQNLDAAFEQTEAPFDYVTYTGLSARYDPNKLKVGEDYIFRGFISSTLDHATAVGSFVEAGQSDMGVVLQLNIQKGQKAIYVDAISNNDGELETIIPRGSMVRILSGPHVIDAATVSNKGQGQISIFECQLIQET